MAELNTGGDGGGKGGKVRSKKSNSKVDLTAMVDLAFLLITFFMLTTSLSKPQSMNLALPDKPKPNDPIDNTKVDENRTMTILLGNDDKLMVYMGFFATPLPNWKPKAISYNKESLRTLVLKAKQEVAAYTTSKGHPEQGIIVIIKPSKKSNYKNLVTVLDEMAITNVATYAIVNDYTPEETKLLEAKKDTL